MSDWKSDLNNRLAQEETKRRLEYAANDRRKQEAEAQKQAAEEAKRRAEYERQLREHQARFKCYVCGKRSPGPGRWTTTERVMHYGSGDPIYWSDDTVEHTSLDVPSGLTKCSGCGQWVCTESDHSYEAEVSSDTSRYMTYKKFMCRKCWGR